ncbi:MAG: hypothetical protein EBS90_10170, partial [Betaproteobacteria bacterium]|nr:hypothetical protein [Betaproteobacteria bacterium]
KLPMPDDGDMPSIHESIPGPHVVTRPSATGETVAIKHVSPGNLFPYDTVTLHVSTTKPTTVVVGQTIRNSDSSTSITTENVGVPEQQYDVAHAFPGMTPTGTALHLLPGTHEIPLTVKNQKAVDTRFVEHTAKSLLDDHSIERPSGNHETHPDSPLGAAITKFGITAEARTEQSVPKLVFDPLETQNALHVALNSHKELPFAVMAHPALSDPPYFTVKYKDVPFVHSNDLPEEAFHVEKQLRVAHVDDIAQLTPANATANIKGQAVVAPSPPLSRRMGNRHTKDEEDDEESSSRSRRRQTKNDDEEEEEEGSSSRRRARSKRDDSEERKPSRKPSRRDAEWA